MKKGTVIVVILLMVLAVGCGVHVVNVDRANIMPSPNEATVSTGDIFFEREVMTGKKNVGDTTNSVFEGNAYRIELIVESISKNQLKLGYSEYMKPPSQFGYYQFRDWVKKPAFSRTYEYNLQESKVVSFQNYSFEIKNIQDGKVTYRRIK